MAPVPGSGGQNDQQLGQVDPKRGPRAYRLTLVFLKALVGTFFRHTEIDGLENIPARGGGIIVAWHPNGLVDPGLILTSFPRQVIFGARHGLFKVPLLGALLRLIGTVPILRATDTAALDPEERRAQNLRSLDALAGQVAAGAFSALFPEGVSHDAPGLQHLKTGAARLYYRARALTPEGAPPPVILPVGLHYDRKAAFRSSALVSFHPPLKLPEALDVVPAQNETHEASRERCHQLTDAIGEALEGAVQSVDDWELFLLLHRSRTLIRAERAARARQAPGPQTLQEKTLGFARVRTAYTERLKSDPEKVAALRKRVAEYHHDIRALGLKDHELDLDPPLASRWMVGFLVMQVLAVFLLMPPILLFGYLINGLPALLLAAAARLGARLKKDVATIKILGGAILFPATWALCAVAAYFGHEILHESFPSLPPTPGRSAAMMVALGVIGGAVALRYQHVSARTIRAVRVRLSKHRRWFTTARLRKERSELTDALLAMAQGIELPGALDGRGRIVAERDNPTFGIELPWEI
ncbi:MAG: 1-acyl-sn-glycerol-3-phosphate acyltransferase [Deltaproteobacteria bacterium]|nr:1-acyl-sn-glycerol-3-phosphate acyltransferase [Deltaproteobacteria bacterium]